MKVLYRAQSLNLSGVQRGCIGNIFLLLEGEIVYCSISQGAKVH